MPLKSATPSKDIPNPNAAPHIRSPLHPPNKPYHPGRHKFVERPYDVHSKLYHPDFWNWHDLYGSQVSYEGSIVTRSQTAFTRKEMNETDVELFMDKLKHHPPDLPHLVVTMKDGTYGALPRTIVTRSMAEKLEINPVLTRVVDAYKTFTPLEEEIKPPKRKSSIFQRLFKKEPDAEPESNDRKESSSVLKPPTFTVPPTESSGESLEE